MRRECRERFPGHRLQKKLLVNDPGKHHDTCVTHVPWCMSGSLTRDDGENVPGIPGACATCNLTYLARCPLLHCQRSTIGDYVIILHQFTTNCCCNQMKTEPNKIVCLIYEIWLYDIDKCTSVLGLDNIDECSYVLRKAMVYNLCRLS